MPSVDVTARIRPMYLSSIILGGLHPREGGGGGEGMRLEKGIRGVLGVGVGVGAIVV